MKSSTTNKILALIIALLLWSYVMMVEKPPQEVTYSNIPVQIENEMALRSVGLAISETSEMVTGVTLVGERSAFKDVSGEDITASVNVAGYAEGKHAISIKITPPDGLTVKSSKPQQVSVVIEPLITKSKPVEVVTTGLEEGTEEGALEISPQEVEVSGAKSKVNAVSSVQVTLDATQLSEKGKTLSLFATAVDSEGMPVEPVELSVEEVDVTAKLLRTKTVDLKVNVTGIPGNGMELEHQNIPKQITIKGTKGDLKEIDTIQAEPLNISGITDNTTLTIEPILPDGIEVARESEDLSATFYLRDIVTKEFTYSNNEIIISGLSSDYTLTIGTPTIKVTVSGSRNTMSSLTKTDLVPTIVADEANPATTSLPVTIKHTKDLNSIAVDPASVTITVANVNDTATGEENDDINQGNEGQEE